MKLPEVSNDWKLWLLDGFFVAYRKWIGGLIPVLYHKTITANADGHLWLQPWLRGQDWMSLENKLPFNPEKSILWARGEAHTRLRKMYLFLLTPLTETLSLILNVSAFTASADDGIENASPLGGFRKIYYIQVFTDFIQACKTSDGVALRC